MSGAQRNEQVDAVKGALILLVIFGHLLEFFLKGSALYRGVYAGIYLFHMPLFVFLTGMFSKGDLAERDYRGLVARLVLPLVVFQVLYLGVSYLQHGRMVIPPLQPFWLLWFFLSVILWKLALPLLVRLPVPMLWAIGLALLAGYDRGIGYAFSLSRTLYFLPFFVAGSLWGNPLERLAARFRVAGVLVFCAAVGAIVAWTWEGLPVSALYGSAGYQALPVIRAHPAVGRAALLGLSAIASVGFLALARCRFRPLVYLGERTLTVFALHGFVVIGLHALARRFGVGDSGWVIPACAVIAVLTAFAIAPLDPWLNRVFGWLARR